MVKEIYQISPRSRKKLLNFNIWWTEGVELLKHGLSYDKGLQLYRKCIRNVDDIWDNEHRNFLTWKELSGNLILLLRNNRIGRSSLVRWLDNGAISLRRTMTNRYYGWIFPLRTRRPGLSLPMWYRFYRVLCTILRSPSQSLAIQWGPTLDAWGNENNL